MNRVIQSSVLGSLQLDDELPEQPAYKTELPIAGHGTVSVTLHDRDGAATIFGRVLEVDPANAEALRFQGDYLYHQKRWEKAVDVFTRMEEGEQARDLDDFDAKIEVSLYFYRFADALQRLGRHAEARARFERALTLNPSHLPTLEAVGPLYVELEAWDKARTVFGTILQLTGGQGDPATIARIRRAVSECPTGAAARA